MAFLTDFTVDYVNKTVKHTSGTTVYTVNQMYSALQDQFDELSDMDDSVPMSAQTPTAYTMINSWYIDDASTQYLTGGAIATSGWDADSVDGGIRKISLASAGYTSAVAGDIGKVVTGGTTGDTGTLIDYDNTNRIWYVRADTTLDAFDDASETLAITAGTGAGTTDAVSTTGEWLWANPYTLGSLEGTPNLYIYQNGTKLTSWWSSGHFDVLVKVTEAGTDIDSKAITVLGRNWTDTYSAFEIILTSAGQNAVPLGTADDLNNQSLEADVEDLQDGTTATIAIDFSFTSPFQYDIQDGNGDQDYVVQIDCDGRSLSDVYEVCKYWTREGSTTQLEVGADGAFVNGEAYRYADDTYSEVVVSPLGTFAGGKFFGARGVYLTNLAPADAQNFQLIDANGVTRTPPNFQSISVTGLVTGDRVAVFEATAGDINKAQYTCTTQSTASGTLIINEAIPSSTPTSGTVIVVNDEDQSEDIYTYTSYSGSTFTLSGTTSNAYTAADTVYVPFIYATATGAIESVSVIYSTDIDVIARVRKKGILPFETTGIYGSTGYSATAIRTIDSIVTI